MTQGAKEARSHPMMPAGVHMEAVRRPERWMRQLAIRPVESPDDIGTVGDSGHDRAREIVSPALDERAEGQLSRRVGAREQNQANPFLITPAQHGAESIRDARDRRQY